MVLTDSAFRKTQKELIQSALGVLLIFNPGTGYADEPVNMDDLGFSSIIDNQLFSASVSLKNQSTFKLGSALNQVQSNIEIESDRALFNGLSSITPLANLNDTADNFDNLASEYRSQGLRVKRLSTSWKSGAGALTVGSDWANFQDYLGFGDSAEKVTKSTNSVASQIKWLSPNGFSIALEDAPVTSALPARELDTNFQSAPSIVLSWQGGIGGTAGQYRVSAMGTDIDSAASGQNFDGSDPLGWGLNLEGGWQIGDLFAALSVTYGKGINSYVLRRFGNELLVTPNESGDADDAFSIRPSLYYSLNENSNFHVALGHYSASGNNDSQSDTLDTIHMGYSWSPWPSTRFGLEVVGQNGQGTGFDIDDTRVKIGAQKLF